MVIPKPFFLSLLAASMLLGTVAEAQTAVTRTRDSRPNIVFMMSDDQSWNGLSVSMHPQLDAKSRVVQTPTLQRLARQGMCFSDAYAPAPVCAATRISLQTGKSPAILHWTKAAPSVRAADGYKMIPPVNIRSISERETTFAELLQRSGYRTAHYGKWHIQGGGPGRHGYDAHDGDIGNEYAARFTDPNPVDIFGMARRAAGFMAESQKVGKPFFIQLSWHALHAPENALKKTLAKYQGQGGKGGGKKADRAAIAEDLDTGVGMVLEALDELGIDDSTYVIYTSDNGGGGGGGGAGLNGGKGSLYEGGIRVPLIVRGPGIKSDSFCTVPVMGVDWFPTFCAWAGIRKLPKGLEGGSLTSLLDSAGKGSVKRSNEGLCFHFPHYQSGDGPHSSIRVDQFKLIKFYETDRVALFDLSKDLGERRDLSSQHKAKAKELEAELNQYLEVAKAQMPQANPQYDPNRAPTERKRGGGNREEKGGRGRRKRDRDEGQGGRPRRGDPRDAERIKGSGSSELITATATATTTIDEQRDDRSFNSPEEPEQDGKPAAAAAFAAFADKLKVRWDKDYIYIESEGMPAHPMMVGIRAWNQQVPLPQAYSGNNAFRLPRRPRFAEKPSELPYLGPVAVAINGVPIFNPIKQDGRTDTVAAGELDEFGGHAGRADDYHYHKAPLHLQKKAGKNKPIAYAMDGFPIYGEKDLDGKKPSELDAAHGHSHSHTGTGSHSLGATAKPSEYHYHSSPAYPYIMSQFRGVVERTNHPRAQGVRPHTPPLRGAHVVSWSEKGGWYEVGYELRNGDKQSIRYRHKGEDSYEFQFIDARGQTVTKTYTGRQRGGGGRGPGRGNENDERGGRRRGPEGRDGQDDRRGPPREREGDGGVRQPWILVHAAELDGNGDGSITRAEMLDQANKTIASYDRDGNGKISSAELKAGGREARLAMAGFVRKHADELDDNGNGLLEAAEILAHAERMFRRADGNGDGVATAKELGQLERGPGSEGGERGQAGGEGRRRGDREGEGAGAARPDKQQRSRRNMAMEIRSGSAAFRTEVPSHPLDIILGRIIR